MALETSTVEWTGTACFSKGWAGFPIDKAITVLIGRNNCGKSRLLDLAMESCLENYPSERKIRFSAEVGDELVDEIMRRWGAYFSQSSHADHYDKWAKSRLTWTFTGAAGGPEIVAPFPEILEREDYAHFRNDIISLISTRLRTKSPWARRQYRHLAAERDIRPENEDHNISLAPNGEGATNVIRAVLLDEGHNERLVSEELLNELNRILGIDGRFTKIWVKKSKAGKCEVQLEETHKGLIPLSKSGSGLKTLVLVLLNLLVLPKVRNEHPRHAVFAFEELENNLHPALLRRLLSYLAAFVEAGGCKLFLTTHSSIVLDLFGARADTQFVHVSHNQEFASTRVIGETLSRHEIISDLGVRPSDLLQANGIVWVEGPSDRVYINRWLNLISDGALIEGIHYQCAFYAGSLLGRTQFKDTSSGGEEYANLLRINRNIAVVFDSDRTASSGAGSELKVRVQRIKEEAEALNAFTWTTWGKEIENYLPSQVLSAVFGRAVSRAPEKHERFFPSNSKSHRDSSFLELELGRATVDKVDLATSAAPHFTIEILKTNEHLWSKLRELAAKIDDWNS